MAPRRLHLSVAGLAAAAALALPPSASAAPAMCTDHDARPLGVTATHLFAKINGSWVEPQNVCVGVKIEEKPLPGGQTSRGLYFGVWNTVDGGFPETHLPPGTQISVGLHFPDGMRIQQTFGRWLDGVVVSNDADTVIQGKTVRWDYHGEAYFGGPGLDCTKQPTTWPSTFTSYSGLNSINADGVPSSDFAQFAGGFYESNTVGALFPTLHLDSSGNPTGLEVQVSGCGDDDPTTLEGYFNGFTPISQFHAIGVTDEMVQDIALLQGMFEIHDLTTDKPISAQFHPVAPGELTLESVPGVTMPAPPGGPGLLGVRTTSAFSYSEHNLIQRGQASAMAALRNCRAAGGTPQDVNGELTCVGATVVMPPVVVPFAATLAPLRVLRRGTAVSVHCSAACSIVAELRAGGKLLAKGRARGTGAGDVKLAMKLTAAGRRRLKSRPSVRANLLVTVTDAKGARVPLHRSLVLKR